MRIDRNFKCKKCFYNKIEVVERGLLYSEVLEVSAYGEFDVNLHSTIIEGIARFQCLNCGWELPVNNYEELYEWLTNGGNNDT